MPPVEENALSIEDIAEAQAGLRQLLASHWSARVLHAAISLGVFDELNRSTLGASELAQAISTHPRATETVLSALVSLGLVEKNDGKYQNSPISNLFLAKSSEFSQVDLARLYASDWNRWEDLESAIRKGNADFASIAGESNVKFVRAIGNSAMVTAPLLAKALDFSQVKRILDLGGAAGRNAIAIATAQPDVEIDVLESETAAPLAQETISQANLQDRIKVLIRDYQKDDLGSDQYHLVLLSNVLHKWNPEQCRTLLGKIYGVLHGEGQCVISDFLLSDDKTGPLFSSLFAVNLLLNIPLGSAFSKWEITDLLQTAGFIRIQSFPLDPTPYALVIGMHP